jgi:hypothetical protein
MSNLPESIRTLVNGFLAIFAKKEDVKQSDLAQNDPTAPDYVKNRTHYEETTVVNEPLNITWDGNTEGLVSVADMVYKVSDIVFTDEQIKLMSETDSGGNYTNYSEMWDIGIEEGWIVPSDDVTICGGIAVARVDEAVGEMYGTSITFPEKGLYFIGGEDWYNVASLISPEYFEQIKTVVHKLDKKFLPDDVATKADILGAMEASY